MVNIGIYIRIEAVLLRLQVYPSRVWHRLSEINFHDRLDALEAVLPRNY